MKRFLAVLYRLSIALVLALCVSSFNTTPLMAFTAGDYLSINYSVSFEPDKVARDKIFYATITGTATCIADLPAIVSEGYITGSIIAVHQESKTEIVLIPEYTLNINPFPTHPGEISEKTIELPLSFPKDSEPGSYSIKGNLIEAKVKSVLWVNVTSHLPEEQDLGSVLCYIEAITTSTSTLNPTITSTKTTTETTDYTADFTLSDLRISPDKIDVNDNIENITVTVHVKNAGNIYGLYQLFLKIDNEIVVTEEIGVLAKKGQDFSFEVPAPTGIGSHIVDINGLIGYLTVSDSDSTNTIQTSTLTATSSSTILVTSTRTATGQSAKNTINDTQMTSSLTTTISSYSDSSNGAGMDPLWIILLVILACDIIIVGIYLLYSHYQKKTERSSID